MYITFMFKGSQAFGDEKLQSSLLSFFQGLCDKEQ